VALTSVCTKKVDVVCRWWRSIMDTRWWRQVLDHGDAAWMRCVLGSAESARGSRKDDEVARGPLPGERSRGGR
jgi:hypothetical protein